MNRWVAWLVAVVIGLLVITSLIGEVWWMPASIQTVVATYPETGWLRTPSMIWGIFVISCWQAILVLALSAIIRHRSERSTLTRAFVAWTSGLLTAVLILVIIAAITLSTHDYLSPATVLGLIGMGLVAAAGAVSVTYAYFAGPGTAPRHT